jgi:hypothetical protein
VTDPKPATEAPAEAAAYETYLPDTPAPPPPPAEPVAPVEAAPDPPRAVTPPPQATPDAQPAAGDAAGTPTTAPAAVAGSGSGTFQWPSSQRRGGGARRTGVVLGIVGLVIIAAVVAAVVLSRGSSSSGPPATSTQKPLPTLTDNPAAFVAGKLESAAPFAGQAWLIKDGNSLLNVEDTSQTADPGDHLFSLAGGNGGLWVSQKTPNGGELIEVKAPNGTTPIKPIPFSKTPAAPRVVIDGNTAWQPVKDGLLRISLVTGQVQPVANISFTPYSVEAAGDAVWATDGKGQIARVPTGNGAPTAKLTPLAGAGWLAPAPGVLYVATPTGVDSIDLTKPDNPPTQLAGLPFVPTRIAYAAGALWLASYTTTGGTGTATVVSVDPATPSRTSTPIHYPVAPGSAAPKLVDISGVFWMKSLRNGKLGVEPLTIHTS